MKLMIFSKLLHSWYLISKCKKTPDHLVYKNDIFNDKFEKEGPLWIIDETISYSSSPCYFKFLFIMYTIWSNITHNTNWYKMIQIDWNAFNKVNLWKIDFCYRQYFKILFCHLLCKSNSEQTCEKALHPVIFDAKNIKHIDIGEPSMYINTSLSIGLREMIKLLKI